MCFSRKGELDNAYKVFKKMPVRDTVSWNSMIAAAVRSSRPKEALILQTRMMRSGVEPDCFSFSTTLSACARAGALSHGKRVHSLMKEKEVDYESNPILCSALIDMYSKCGEISMARRIFYNVKRLSVSIWNSMISGLAMHGLGSDAVQVFEDMTKEGFFPDEVTFVGILTACSHCGMLDEARFYFTAMQQDYYVKPQAEHYCAMVDAMARAGKVVDAYETIKAMPIEPDAAIWRALLGPCRRHGRRDLAEMALGQMRQCGGEDYVLLSSMYCSVKQWGRAESMWRVMKAKKLRKAKGLSWFEVKGRVHQFKAGDRSHSKYEHIVRILVELTRRAKEEGLVQVTESVAEESKKSFLLAPKTSAMKDL
ncbi:hypothetical protein HPP92_009871 [Vanilla planifolia]|uniref:Pentatricopeptide repeat-containing protein n=1 Tax=Vanilla planifolia TaxID=51239 RepID=A0A835RGL4_VANPL|nr:hypothetical protein HPP92_009871 [Vanilla planifolia]